MFGLFANVISEKLYVDYANKQTDVKIVLCRYGNVLESTGSVIPFFKSILEDRVLDYIPITHPDMTRFLLTLEDAVSLIEWAYKHPDSHGNIVIPNIKALKVTDIADCLVNFYRPTNGWYEGIKVVGVRPGEKLHELMINFEESLRTKDYGKYYMITDDILHDKPWQFSSESSLMDSTEAKNFLIKTNVIHKLT